jgi:hypothetical protein
MRAVNVYAWHSQLSSQGRVQICSNARNEAYGVHYPSGTMRGGQSGWHVGLPFDTLGDLGQKLNRLELPENLGGGTLQRGELQRLGIDAHGSPGRFYPNGVVRSRALTRRTVPNYRDELRQIGLMTASQTHSAYEADDRSRSQRQYEASTILLLGCNSAADEVGSAFLRRLSYEWPARRVVGFSVTVVHLNPISRRHRGTVAECVRPFPMDAGERIRQENVDEWMHYNLSGQESQRIPFASPDSPSAKWARDGQIIHRPSNERGASLVPGLIQDGRTGPVRSRGLRPYTRLG